MDNADNLREETRDRIFRSSAWVTGAHQNLCAWEAQGKIFGVVYDGRKHYAAYQFDREGNPVPVMQEILWNMRGIDPWAIAAWFEFPNSWISTQSTATSPKEALDTSELVLHAALRRTGSYVA